MMMMMMMMMMLLLLLVVVVVVVVVVTIIGYRNIEISSPLKPSNHSLRMSQFQRFSSQIRWIGISAGALRVHSLSRLRTQ